MDIQCPHKGSICDPYGATEFPENAFDAFDRGTVQALKKVWNSDPTYFANPGGQPRYDELFDRAEELKYER